MSEFLEKHTDYPYVHDILEMYGASYHLEGESELIISPPGDLYSYTVLVGEHKDYYVSDGDSMLKIGHDQDDVWWLEGGRGGSKWSSDYMAVVLRGYSCGEKMCGLEKNTNLPYVDGCSTRQLFPPERVGDPTMQQLTIPPWTSEQRHHFHPTARVVYVFEGRGFSIIGQKGHTEETKLRQGMIIVLNPMCPHHFRTEEESITVIPVHVFSSTPAGLEFNHPMMNGTKEI